jgi:hypothetical protein
VPLACDGFEGIVSRNLCGSLTLLFHYGRVDTSSKVTLGFIPRRARLHQPDGGIDADCKGALLAMPPIGQAPVFGSVRIDQEVQAAAVGELARLDLPLGIPALRIREWHVGISALLG